MLDKPTKFKVDEKIKIMWNQTSHHKIFCSNCGFPFLKCRCDKKGIAPAFRKLIGVGLITKVFPISIDKNQNTIPNVSEFAITNPNKSATDFEDLVKKDGFESSKKMFKWFDDHYDFTNTKLFWVYRWRWI
jgi:hypothetical protein